MQKCRGIKAGSPGPAEESDLLLLRATSICTHLLHNIMLVYNINEIWKMLASDILIHI